MKSKLLALFAGILTLTVVAVPLTAQACDGTKNNQEASQSDIPEQTSVTAEDNLAS